MAPSHCAHKVCPLFGAKALVVPISEVELYEMYTTIGGG